MSCAACSRDDGLKTASFGGLGVCEEEVGRAMCRHDLHLERHVQALEHLGGMCHRLPIGDGTHDDANARGAHCACIGLLGCHGAYGIRYPRDTMTRSFFFALFLPPLVVCGTVIGCSDDPEPSPVDPTVEAGADSPAIDTGTPDTGV